jgi:phosphoribosylglycinamide formyltransferase-1
MRILSKNFCLEWKDKILNVHPSLLPKYAGGMDNDVHKKVLKNNDSETGCTIHFVTEELDAGPILVQKKCVVEVNDTPSSLKKRVQKLEGQAFLEAINLIQNNKN